MRTITTLLAFTFACAPALAQSSAQKRANAINHIAQVMAIELECSEYEANPLNVAVLMSGYGIEIDKEPDRSRMTKTVNESRSGLRSAGNKIGCLVGWGLYGPGGQNVPNLLRKK